MDKFSQLYEAIYNIIAPDQMSLYEMTNLASKHTGLDYPIFVSGKGGAKHGPRIKVSNTKGKFDFDDSFSMSIEHDPQKRAGQVKIPSDHVEKVKDWIRLNHDFLHKMWHSDTMDSEDHVNGLKKI